METALEDEEEEIEIRRLSPETAHTLRGAINFAGFAAFCPMKPCQRAKACVTRHVLCWQVAREDVLAVVMLACAHDWRRCVAVGEPTDYSPANVEKFKYILAAEDAGFGESGADS